MGNVETRQLPGSASGEKRRRFNVDFYNQWAGIVGRNNWYDFDLVKLSFEHSPYKGSTEVEARLLGLGVIVTYVWDWTFTENITSLRDEVVADFHAMGATEVHDPFNQLDKLDKDGA